MIRRFAAALTVAFLCLFWISPSAQASPQTRLVEEARLVVERFVDDPDFANLPIYMQNAYGVLIAPDLLQAGFFFGAEYGQGVMLARDPDSGRWGPPIFVDLYGGSFGVQFGGQSANVIYAIMNQEALLQILYNRVKLGAGVSMTAGDLSRGVGADTTMRFGEDVYAFSKGRGLFGGLAVDGSVVVVRPDWNAAYYGKRLGAEEILRATAIETAFDAPLRAALRRFDANRTAAR